MLEVKAPPPLRTLEEQEFAVLRVERNAWVVDGLMTKARFVRLAEHLPALRAWFKQCVLAR